jgi:hypothetical protein
MVYVFKTSVKYKKQIHAISKQFDKIESIEKWNVDLEDCDKILRIESQKNITSMVYLVLHSLNISCTELE